MLFEHALFYPTIDIKDVAWLKSSVLLWDTISTIVPESEYEPYKSECSRAFASEGIVLPHRVNPYNVNFQGLETEVRCFLNSPEGKRSFKPRIPRQTRYMEPEDFIQGFHESERLNRDYGEFKISAEKFGNGLTDVIRDFVNEDGYVIASYAFMNFYMTSLANRICQGIDTKALLTNLMYTSDLTNHLLEHSPNQRMGEELMGQGLMYKYLINGISINPNTPIDKIIKFRNKYKDERDLFKYEISDLIQNANLNGLPQTEFVNQVGRLYRTKVLPSLAQLEKALNGMRIDTIKTTVPRMLVTGITAFDPVGVGSLLSRWKMLKDVGLSVWRKIANYNKEQEKTFMNSPYSYLYRMRHINSAKY